MSRTGPAEPPPPAGAPVPGAPPAPAAPAAAELQAADASPVSAAPPLADAPPVPAAPPVALYVHVPFCRSLCPYCDFVVYAGADAVGPRNRVDAFLAALGRELDLRADVLDAAFGPPGGSSQRSGGSSQRSGGSSRPPLDSLYLGGGTPSLLPAEAVEALVAAVRARFGLAAGAEVTLEANPGPDDRGDLAGFARAGVTRISLGAQSLDDAELRRLGRRHFADDVGEAVAAARAAGIAGVSLDLLYEVPDQQLATWAATVEAAIGLGPDHVSCYALTLDDPDAEGLTGPMGDHLPTTPGARRWRDRARRGQDEDRAAAAYALADAALDSAGMPWYELSNWSRPGAASRHNIAYWERRPYEALGPGAHAFDGLRRRWNAASLAAWIGALVPAGDAAPALPPGGFEVLSDADAAAEELILGLRMARGIPRASALARPELFAWAAEMGLIEDGPDGRVRLTLRGRLLSNELFSRLV